MRSRYSCRDNFDHMRPSEKNKIIRNKINIIICPNKTYLIESKNVIIRDEIKSIELEHHLRNAEKFNLNDFVCVGLF